MDTQAVFGLSILMSFIAFALVARYYIWPRLRTLGRTEALLPLVLPHTFRFVGLGFLVPGVISPSLPPAFAVPAAYGSSRGDTRGRRFHCASSPGRVGHAARLAVQSVGHYRPSFCVLSRVVRRPA